jgi:imidazolonepropionase-like amidohydrolase
VVASACAVLGAALLLASCLGPRVRQRQLVRIDGTPPALVFRGVDVFTGTSRDSLREQDVVVEGERVVAVRPSGSAPLPAGARVVEGAGHTLLPGLVDAHVHLLGSGAPGWAPRDANPEHNAEAYLYAGVTTVYDLAGFITDLHGLRARIDAGEVPGPRIFFSGPPVVAPGGMPLPTIRAAFPFPVGEMVEAYVSTVLHPVAKPELAASAIDDVVEDRADFVKVMYDAMPTGTPQLSRETLRAIVDAAHARSMKVFAHVGSVEDTVFAAEAGVDILAHGPVRGELTDADIERIRATGVPVIFNLVAWRELHELAEGRWRPTRMAQEITPPDLLETVTSDEGTRFENVTFRDMAARAERWVSTWSENARRLHEAGVRIIVGSDSTVQGVYAGSAIHEEMRLLKEAGIDTATILLGATSRAAGLFLDDPDFGTVEVGKRADLLLVQGDPLQDIEATTRIVHVVQGGRVVERRTP